MTKLARAAALVILLVVSVAGPVQADITNGAPPARSCIPVDECCKVCDAGQACGKSCISAEKTCHKGRGCACNASEVCAG